MPLFMEEAEYRRQDVMVAADPVANSLNVGLEARVAAR